MEECEYSEITVTGSYTPGFEMSVFTPEGTDEWWFARGQTEEVLDPLWEDSLNRFSEEQAESKDGRAPYSRYAVTFSGMLSPKGQYGHFGTSSREMIVTDLVSWEYLEN